MKRIKRMLQWTMGVSLVLAVLLIAAALIVPHLVNTGPIRSRIQAEIARQSAVAADIGELRLVFFPMPHVVIENTGFEAAETAVGTFRAMRIYPHLLPLLTARLRPAKIVVIDPDVRIRIAPEASEAPSPSSVSDAPWRRIASDAIAAVRQAAPDVRLRVENGTMLVDAAGYPPLRLDGLDWRLDTHRLETELSCSSDLWEQLTIRWTVAPGRLPGTGRIGLAQFKPHLLPPSLLEQLPLTVGDSLINLNLQVRTEPDGQVAADLTGSVPRSHIGTGGAPVRLSVKAIDAAISIGPTRQHLVVDRMVFETPSVEIAGEVDLSDRSPAKQIRIRGTDVDVAGVRSAVLALAGDQPVVRDIFDIIRGGTVPEIAYTVTGDSWESLSELRRMNLEGDMVDGHVAIADVGLDLKQVNGHAVISDGELTGSDLRATTGNSTGSGGSLRIGFKGKDAPFHLDIGVRADLAELPDHLKRLIPDPDVTAGLDRIETVTGAAEGRLILGDRLSSISPTVHVSDVQLDAAYTGIPYPIAVETGRVRFEGRQLSVDGLSGRLQGSRVSGLTAGISWEQDIRIQVATGDFDLFLPEVLSWLQSSGLVADRYAPYTAVSGRLVLDRAELEGPLQEPEKWDFAIGGTIPAAAFQTPMTTGAVAISRMMLTATPGRLAIASARVDAGDTGFDLSGTLEGTVSAVSGVDLNLTGRIGPEGLARIRDIARIPDDIAVAPPVALSDFRVHWETPSQLTLAGTADFPEQLRVTTDATLSPDVVDIRRLALQDDQSRAAIRFRLKHGLVHAEYSGNLEKSTVAKLFDRQHVRTGRIAGNFKTHVDLDHPEQSTVTGLLSGSGLVLPFGKAELLRIDAFQMAGKGDAVDIGTFTGEWAGSRWSLTGRVAFTPEQTVADLSLQTGTIDWKRVSTAFDSGSEPADPDRTSGWPMKATVAVRSERFVFDAYQWEPVDADVIYDEGIVRVDVKQAVLCGMATPGTLIRRPDGSIDADFELASRETQLSDTASCLFKDMGRVDGTYRFKGTVSADGMPDQLRDSLRGNLEFHARNGRIYSQGGFGVVQKVLAFINVTEIFAGATPDFSGRGFGYNSIRALAEIDGRNLVLTETVVDGQNIKLTSQGTVDLNTDTLNLYVIAAPLKTVDRVVKNLPIFNEILEGSLITIPLKVTGPISDPTVSPISPGKVGRGLIGITERTLKAPFKLIQP